MQLSGLRPSAALLAALAAAAISASPAAASYYTNKVNEVMLQSSSGDSSVQFVEFLDEGGPSPGYTDEWAPYNLFVYDAAGNVVGHESLNAAGLQSAANSGTEYLVSTAAADAAFHVTGDQTLTVKLPLEAGQACYTFDPGNIAASCITWGCITHAVDASAGTGSAHGPVPPPGESDQRQPNDSIETAPPTPGAANASGTSSPACASQSGGGSRSFAGVRVEGHKLRLRPNGHVGVALACPSGSGGCSGRVTLKLKDGTSLGGASFTLGDGKTRRVKVKLRASKLASKHKVHGEAVVVSSDGAGQMRTTIASIVLVRPKAG